MEANKFRRIAKNVPGVSLLYKSLRRRSVRRRLVRSIEASSGIYHFTDTDIELYLTEVCETQLNEMTSIEFDSQLNQINLGKTCVFWPKIFDTKDLPGLYHEVMRTMVGIRHRMLTPK